MSGAYFFTAPIRFNPTINTPIPDHPARFSFLVLIAKYLDEILPDPDQPGDITEPDRTSVRIVLRPCLMLICHHFFYSLVYANVYHVTSIKIYPQTVKKKKHTCTEREKTYPVPNPTPFSKPRPDPEWSKIRPLNLIFFGGCMVRFGDPRWSGVPPLIISLHQCSLIIFHNDISRQKWPMSARFNIQQGPLVKSKEKETQAVEDPARVFNRVKYNIKKRNTVATM